MYMYLHVYYYNNLRTLNLYRLIAPIDRRHFREKKQRRPQFHVYTDAVMHHNGSSQQHNIHLAVIVVTHRHSCAPWVAAAEYKCQLISTHDASLVKTPPNEIAHEQYTCRRTLRSCDVSFGDISHTLAAPVTCNI